MSQIKLFAHYSPQVIEEEVNNWIGKNCIRYKIIDIKLTQIAEGNIAAMILYEVPEQS